MSGLLISKDNFTFRDFRLSLQKLVHVKLSSDAADTVNNSQKNLDQSLYPEIRIYENPSTITYEASIRSGLLKDYYITMSNIDRSDYYNIKFQKKPFMMWIWISVIFISLGGFLRLFKNAKKDY